MKKNSLWHIIWIVGIYAVLVSILYLVVTYKVKWENKDLRPYLYFYNCDHELCSTQTKPDTYYSLLLCDNDVCPYIVNKNNNILILSNGKKSMLFDYINEKILNNNYSSYRLASDGNYIVKDKNNLYGVINPENNPIVEFNYQYIKDYANGYILYKEEGKYGVDNIDKNIFIKPEYENIDLINDDLFIYTENNKYFIASYKSGLSITQNTYDYVKYIDNYIITIKNKQIDILDTKLTSKLIMKINTTYNYETEGERNSLDIYSKNNYIYFKVIGPDNKYTTYMYDTKGNKLY